VRGRIDALLGRTVFEVKSDLRREKRDADRQLAIYLRDREAETEQSWIGVATDGAEFYVAMLRDDKLAELGTFRTNAELPRSLLAWLESVVVLNVELPPTVEGIRTELGRDSIHYRRAMKEIEALWGRLEDHPEALLKRGTGRGRKSSATLEIVAAVVVVGIVRHDSRARRFRRYAARASWRG
jgi:hypothetical protein